MIAARLLLDLERTKFVSGPRSVMACLSQGYTCVERSLAYLYKVNIDESVLPFR